MSKKRQLGYILLDSGRITQEEVERVLEYQRTHGGFFGQGLVALGILTRDEVDYFLSHQLDLPYIFPDAAAVDREAAALVTPEWALTHLAVPMLRAGNQLTVVAPEPLAEPQVNELEQMTGCEVQLALASAARIRELIHAVYGDSASTFAEAPSISLGEFVAEALDSGAPRFGVSVRGSDAAGWYRTTEVERFSLSDGWDVLLNEMLRPGPADKIDARETGPVRWDASLHRGTSSLPVRVRALVGHGGVEYLFEPSVVPSAKGSARQLIIPSSIATELRLLARSGKARVGVTGSDAEYVEFVLPQLPRLTFEHPTRAVHITDQRDSASGAYTIYTDQDAEVVTDLAAYAFDVATVDIRTDASSAAAVLDAAPLTFVLVSSGTPQTSLGWLLHIDRSPAGTLTWNLQPAST